MSTMKRKSTAVSVEAVESRLLFAVVSVLNTADSGAGSLREALANAAAGDTVDLTNVTGTIALASELSIDKDLTLAGPGADALAISGDDDVRVLEIAAGSTVTVSGLTLTEGGSASFGGAIYNAGELTLDHVVVSDSAATQRGGGIYNLQSLTMTDSSVLGNSIAGGTFDGYGGGIYSETSSGAGGGIHLTACTVAGNSVFADDTAGFTGALAQGGGIALFGFGENSMVNCTVSGNTASATGGGAIAFHTFNDAVGGGIADADNGPLDLTNCTITENTATATASGSIANAYGGGIYHLADGGGIISNSLIAANHADFYPDTDNWGNNHVASGGHNLIGAADNTGIFVDGVNADHVGPLNAPIDPLLGPLSDNGGPTMTHGLLPTSLAIDNGDAEASPATDQRGVARDALPDVGAFEAAPVNTIPSFTSTAVTDATSESAYQYDITSSDTDGDALTITALGDLPAWLTLTDHGDGTATLAGTPSNLDAGENDVTLVLGDGRVETLQSFAIDVAGVNHAPGLAPLAQATAVAAAAFEQTVHASDPDGDDLAFEIVSKPQWITVIDNQDGTATLTGTPGTGDGGSSSVVLKAGDGTDFSLEQTYTINVATLRWELSGGILTVTGTDADDSIALWQKGQKLRLVHNGTIKTFAAADVLGVKVYTFDGNDTVSLNLRADVAGYAVGGAGNDTLVGGDESDILSGGGGKDVLFGGGGNDRLNGFVGNDQLDGGTGDDRLFGGDGDDLFDGGSGSDQLRGGDGDDVLNARDQVIDVVSGGAGNNSAQVDDADQVTDVITLLA